MRTVISKESRKEKDTLLLDPAPPVSTFTPPRVFPPAIPRRHCRGWFWTRPLSGRAGFLLRPLRCVHQVGHLRGRFRDWNHAEPITYFTSISTKGKVRYGKFPFAISVLDSPENHIPIGMASSVTATDGGLAIWRLTVRHVQVPDRFVVIDGAFLKFVDAAE
jgi:hypothetical protein